METLQRGNVNRILPCLEALGFFFGRKGDLLCLFSCSDRNLSVKE